MQESWLIFVILQDDFRCLRRRLFFYIVDNFFKTLVNEVITDINT